MDILIKLRLYLWLMVLCLWGIMIYQFLEDETGELPQMRWVTSRIATAPPPAEPVSHAQLFPPRPAEDLLQEPAPPSSTLPKQVDRAREEAALAALPHLRALPTTPQPIGPAPVDESAPRPVPERPVRPAPTAAEPATPKGFLRTQTRHFNIYAEGTEAPAAYVDAIENLHANLMLDLAAFSPWARDERVSIYLFRSQDSYRRVTGRPSWSGGASSVKGRKIYLYESEESIGILAHELCHIYFDSFFLGGRSNPLWLSEGMATLVQTERGLAAPNWLKENMEVLRRGGGYALTELLSVENTAGADDASVRLWYTQAYSVVRFLIRAQYKSSFFRFSALLKDGVAVHDALYRAYGMPFNRVKALEYAWRYDLQQHRM
ncbi:MAG: hypothetical protein WC969_02745 [Elusimicrobiota bacterium]|jgi:hypothetical protein